MLSRKEFEELIVSDQVQNVTVIQNKNVPTGRDLAHTSRGYGESMATVIDSEVKRIIDECYSRARSIIKEHEDVLHACANLLLEKEKITREEFEALFEKREDV